MSSSPTADEANTSDRRPLASCWDMYHLPPFYTKQPVAETFETQAFMWAEVMFGLCQASLHTESTLLLDGNSPDGIDEATRQSCPFAALVTCALTSTNPRGGGDASTSTSSSIFFNQNLLRRAPPSVIRRAMYLAATELFPDYCITNVTSIGAAPTTPAVGFSSITLDGKNPWLLVMLGNPRSSTTKSSSSAAVATPPPTNSSAVNSSGAALQIFSLRSLRERLMQWVLEEGGGYTLPNLITKGVVATFEELVDGDVLRYGLKKAEQIISFTSHHQLVKQHVPVVFGEGCGRQIPCPTRSSTAVSYEAVLRILIDRQLGSHSSSDTAANPLCAANVELFNLDGSNTVPFEGVKFGGKSQVQ